MEPHSAAELFPIIDTSSFDELRRDIREHGLIEPIVLFDGKILDGRNRYRAMRFIDPDFSPERAPKMFTQFDGTDPVQFVVSKNLHRRHLNESQRAIIAAKISLATPGKNRWATGMSTPKVAKLLNVSSGHVNEAKRLIKERPQDVSRIMAGEARIGTRRGHPVLSVDVPLELRSAFVDYCGRKHCSVADELRQLIHAAVARDEEAGCPTYPTPEKVQRQSPEGKNEKYRDILAGYDSAKTARANARAIGVSPGLVNKILKTQSMAGT